jgi:hypothetical protein
VSEENMDRQARQERLEAELERLRALTKMSSIFRFQGHGEPPDQYTFVFRGRGVARSSTAQADVDLVEMHKIELRLPYAFPHRPPDIRC